MYNYLLLYNSNTVLIKHTLTALAGLAFLAGPQWDSEYHELTG